MSKPFKTPAQELLDTGQLKTDSEPERYDEWMLWKARQKDEYPDGYSTIWREAEMKKKYIYESPDKGKTVYRREFGMARKDKEPFIQYGKDEHEVFLAEGVLEELDKQHVVTDMVNHPPHYNKGIETAEYINSYDMGYSQGNIIKYVTRYNLKSTDLRKQREDLAKAKWYLNDLIVQLEKKIDSNE